MKGALSDLNLQGTRVPRSMLPHAAAERLIAFLGVQLVDDCDEDLEAAAREWLASLPAAGHHNRADSPATLAVRRALERIDRGRT